jgi:TolB-like protein
VILAATAAVLAWIASGSAARPSVAVRFEYGGSSDDDAHIANGIAIEITRLLAQIDGLDVRAAMPVSRYSVEWTDAPASGVEGGAGLVLEGVVMSEAGVPNRIRASLVRGRERRVLWSKWFTPENNDILTVHGAIVGATAEALGLRMQPDQRRYTTDPALQTRFLRARGLQGDRRSVTRPEAVELFDQITKQASSFVPAFAALATTLGGHLSIAGWLPLDSRMAAAARIAYEADARLAEANVAMGLLSARMCQWTRADTYFVEALRLDPSAAAAYTDYVISTLLPLGRTTDALEVLRSALVAAPMSADVRRTLGYVQLQNSDHRGAIQTSGWVVEHYPDLEFADQSRGRALYLSRRIEEALEWFSTEEGQWGHRGYVLALMGRRHEARALADAHPREPARQMLIYAGLNDAERALDALRRTALDNPWRGLVWMGWPEIEPVLRGDPRATAIRAQLLRPADEGGCTFQP